MSVIILLFKSMLSLSFRYYDSTDSSLITSSLNTDFNFNKKKTKVTLYVSQNGNDSTGVANDVSHQFKTINSAISKYYSADMIEVCIMDSETYEISGIDLLNTYFVVRTKDGNRATINISGHCYFSNCNINFYNVNIDVNAKIVLQSTARINLGGYSGGTITLNEDMFMFQNIIPIISKGQDCSLIIMNLGRIIVNANDFCLMKSYLNYAPPLVIFSRWSSSVDDNSIYKRDSTVMSPVAIGNTGVFIF